MLSRADVYVCVCVILDSGHGVKSCSCFQEAAYSAYLEADCAMMHSLLELGQLLLREAVSHHGGCGVKRFWNGTDG